MSKKLAKVVDVQYAAEVESEANNSITEGFRTLAALMTKDLTPAAAGLVLARVREYSELVEQYEKQTKKRIEAALLEKGEVVTDKGSRRMESEGFSFFMKPWRTGYDAKKVEAKLRMKKIDPKKYMTEETVYSVSQEGMEALAKKKLLTPEELRECEYEVKWTIETPKPVKDVTPDE